MSHNMQRRTWLKSVSAGALGMGLATSLDAEAPAFYRASELAIITNTVGPEMKDNWREAIQMLARIGYRYLEGNVPEGVDTEEYKKVVGDSGLSTIALGSALAPMRQDLTPLLRSAEHLEARYVVCYWPWMSGADKITYEETMGTAEGLNQLGKQVKDAGFRLVWHNHANEFVRVRHEELVFELLMENTDPDLVGVQLDWYWVAKGNDDPVRLYKRYPGRYDLAHVKDMNNNKDRGMTCAGSGILDFAPMIEHARQAGTRYLIVENERAIKGYACARGSFHHLASLL